MRNTRELPAKAPFTNLELAAPEHCEQDCGHAVPASPGRAVLALAMLDGQLNCKRRLHAGRPATRCSGRAT